MSKNPAARIPPPQLYAPVKIEAAHYRTAQFLLPLLADGHQICLCTTSPGDQVKINIQPDWQGQLDFQPIAFDQFGWMGKLQKVHDAFMPDCVIAVNFDMCIYATKLKTDRPVWMDIYGDMITIVQAACYRWQANRGLPTTLMFAKQVFQKGDKFSVCGTAQRNMAVGELAMSGRLNYQSFGYEFTEVIPAGMDTSHLSEPTDANDQAGHSLRTEAGIGKDDFVVLWCGGYNTWTDVETLFKGLESAMQEDPRIHFISAGANTYRSANNTYTQFQELIKTSPYRERFHLYGWQPWNKLREFYLASNAGINIDAIHYETIYGTRTRLMEMIQYHLPIITTLGTELSFMLKRHQAALTFEVGDWRKLRDHILQLVCFPETSRQMEKMAYHYSFTELSFEATTKNLRNWAAQPQQAPDYPSFNKPSLQIIEQIHLLRARIRFTLWSLLGSSK